MLHFNHWKDYKIVVSFIITDIIGMVIDLLNFGIIAKVIYQSSRVNRAQSDVSLLCYLREQYLQLQK